MIPSNLVPVASNPDSVASYPTLIASYPSPVASNPVPLASNSTPTAIFYIYLFLIFMQHRNIYGFEKQYMNIKIYSK